MSTAKTLRRPRIVARLRRALFARSELEKFCDNLVRRCHGDAHAASIEYFNLKGLGDAATRTIESKYSDEEVYAGLCAAEQRYRGE